MEEIVYFLMDLGTLRIKIGQTNNVFGRGVTHRTSNINSRLLATIPGDKGRETEIHQKWAGSKVPGTRRCREFGNQESVMTDRERVYLFKLPNGGCCEVLESSVRQTLGPKFREDSSEGSAKSVYEERGTALLLCGIRVSLGGLVMPKAITIRDGESFEVGGTLKILQNDLVPVQIGVDGKARVQEMPGLTVGFKIKEAFPARTALVLRASGRSGGAWVLGDVNDAIIDGDGGGLWVVLSPVVIPPPRMFPDCLPLEPFTSLQNHLLSTHASGSLARPPVTVHGAQVRPSLSDG